MIKAVIFDFFDVIMTDPYNAWLKKHGFKREGPFLEASQEQDLGRITIEEFLERLSYLSGKTVTREIFESGAVVDYDIVELIKILKENYRVGMLSNSPSASIREVLHEHNLEQYFNEIVISSEVGLIKPSIEIFAHILGKLDVDASEAIFIDDNQHHIAGAQKAGLSGIHFLSAGQLRHELLHLEVKV